MQAIITPETFSAIMRKAKSLLSMKKYKEALDVIILIQEDVDNFFKFGEERMLVFYNNAAVLYYLLRKPYLCHFYLNKVLEMYLFRVLRRNLNEINIRERQIFNSITICKVMYNMGLCMLFIIKPVEAFEYFKKATQGMHKSSIAWLRLAECCMMAYKQSHEGVFNYLENRNKLLNGRLGCGLLSKLVLNNKLYRDSAFVSDFQTFDGIEPNLGFASLCLKNSLLLLPPGNNKLRQAILTASSYVLLTIGDTVKAYEFARTLFNTATFHIYKYLSKLYMAESLVMLNRFQEAIDILKAMQFNDFDSSDDSQSQKWYLNVQLTSHAVLDYNLTVALVLLGDFHKASELLKNLWRFKDARNEVPVQIIALALYIELVLGHIDVARIIIKHNCPHLFDKK